MTSTSAPERTVPARARRAARPFLVVAFWLGAWQVVAIAVGHEVLLASPASVVTRLVTLLPTAELWATVGHSLLRIGGGFVVGAVVGVVLAVLAASYRTVDTLLTPLVDAVRSTPVVSVIILALIWADSGRLALLVSATMVVPVVYANVVEGIGARDRRLLEMAAVFGVPRARRLVPVDVPGVLPFFVAACRIGVGLAWKSGVAAEVIGLPQGSIGERLYDAKILLSTADLFAWTVVVVVLSHLLERLVLRLLTLAGPAPVAVRSP